MTQWEFQALKNESPAAIADVVERFNDLGKDGWELCGFEYGYAIFKRPVVEPKPKFVGEPHPYDPDDEDPRDRVEFNDDDPGVRWFLNECGDPYAYPAHLQAEHYPNDDHRPFFTKEEAEAYLDEKERGEVQDFAVDVTIQFTTKGGDWDEDSAADWVQQFMNDVLADENYDSEEYGEGIVEWSFVVPEAGARRENDVQDLLQRVTDLFAAFGDPNSNEATVRRMAVELATEIDRALRGAVSGLARASLAGARTAIAREIFGMTGGKAGSIA